MSYYLILCRSVTQAQRAGRLLAAAGITYRIFRSPAGLTERGCSYSVKVSSANGPRALSLITGGGIRPVKTVIFSGGEYTEVTGP